jgi:hypothetical protein
MFMTAYLLDNRLMHQKILCGETVITGIWLMEDYYNN